MAALTTGSDAEVGLSGFAGAVDHAAHDGDLKGEVSFLQQGLRFLRNPDHVDLGAPTGRAGDEVDTLAFAQPERLEKLAPGSRLLDRVGGQGVPDRVADAFS